MSDRDLLIALTLAALAGGQSPSAVVNVAQIVIKQLEKALEQYEQH